MRILIFVLSCLFVVPALAQETTLDPGPPQPQNPNNPHNPNQPREQSWSPRPNNLEGSEQPAAFARVMVVPFEAKLYRSDGDRALAEANNMSVYELRHRLRYGLTEAIFREVARNHKGLMIMGGDDEMREDLGYIYQSIGYQYKEVPNDQPEVPKNKVDELWGKAKALKNKVIPPEEEPEPGTRVNEGQVVTVWDKADRYMNTRIHNPAVLDYLGNKYECEYFVFINQLDMLIAPGTDYRELESELYKRELKVHYTIIDRAGNEVRGGAARAILPSYQTDLDRIVKGKFTYIAKQIALWLPEEQLSAQDEGPGKKPAADELPSEDGQYEMEDDF